MAKKQFKTLEELQSAIQAQLENESLDVAALTELFELVFVALVAARDEKEELIVKIQELESTLEAQQTSGAEATAKIHELERFLKDEQDAHKTKTELLDQANAELSALAALRESAGEIEKLVAEHAALKEKLELSELTAKDPNAARLRSINGDKNLEVTVEEDGKKRKARFVFKVNKFNIPGKGELTAREILDNPDRYAEVIARLIERKSPILVEVGKKKAK